AGQIVESAPVREFYANPRGNEAGIHISQDHGEGMIIHGTRQWTDYRVDAGVTVHLGRYAGLATGRATGRSSGSGAPGVEADVPAVR
ncbi:MAG: hypothetical protein OXI81_18330, partial [Paracoccaceae bacterium]|nr:hypothetical protein [Paracoccaceae bacterium]MDE2911351.1 hypothetical protein [Paracoccaceae bacterium]